MFIFQTDMKRLGPPYGDCIHFDSPPDDHLYDTNYSPLVRIHYQNRTFIKQTLLFRVVKKVAYNAKQL